MPTKLKVTGYERWDGGSWFAEVFTEPSGKQIRKVYKVLERVYNPETSIILEVISSLPEDWAQTPLWKDESPLPWCHVTEGLAELPEALQQTASQLLMKHSSTGSSGVDQGPSSRPQQLPSPPQQLSQQPPSQEMKRPRQQESPQVSSSRPRRAIQVGLLSPPELSSEHQVSRPKPSGSSSNGNQKKKFRAKRPQKTHPKAIDVATSS